MGGGAGAGGMDDDQDMDMDGTATEEVMTMNSGAEIDEESSRAARMPVPSSTLVWTLSSSVITAVAVLNQMSP